MSTHHSRESRPARRGRLFWAEPVESQRLEERTLLSLAWTEFPLPLAEVVRPTSVTTGPDGNLWFTESAADRIGRMTPGGAPTESPLPDGLSAPYAITSGPDGNLWFSAVQGSGPESPGTTVVVRMTTAGHLTTFDVPTDGTIADITPGPDGALWFAESASKIGRITTAGQVTEYDLPELPPGSNAPPGTTSQRPGPRAIIAGPDGALWFTATTSDYSEITLRIGRLSTDGTFTFYEVAAPQQYEFDFFNYDITAGPDGRLWFSGVDGKAGAITTTGTVSLYDLPDGATARGMTDATDGNVWFTTDHGIGRVKPAGSVTLFAAPSPDQSPGAITRGPDGRVWALETDTDSYEAAGPLGLTAVAPDGAATFYAVPRGITTDPDKGHLIFPGDLAVGPDGAFWFTLGRGPDGIGRMTTAGTYSAFALPDPSFTPTRIVSGMDGNLWFIASKWNDDFSSRFYEIGRVTPAGQVSTIPVQAGLEIKDLTPGPDGNLWFTQNRIDEEGLLYSGGVGTIGRITPGGMVTTFRVPFHGGSKLGAVQAITAGPDGNLWFTALRYDRDDYTGQSLIGRVTRRGVFTLYPIPRDTDPDVSGDSSPPSSIVAGPHGLLWFIGSVRGTYGIGRISTSGKLGPMIEDSTGREDELLAGPNHQLWFHSVGVFGFSYDTLARATASGVVTSFDLPDSFGFYPHIGGKVVGPDGQIWMTNGRSKLFRVSGHETPLGALDNRVPRQFGVDPYDHRLGNTVVVRRPQFAGTAEPGAVVTLSVRRQGQTRLTAVGTVHASRNDGTWALTSRVRLADGAYEVVAARKGESGPPSVLYTLETDYPGDYPKALIVDATQAPKVTRRRNNEVAARSESVPHADLARRLAATGVTQGPNRRTPHRRRV